jgi:hypothetical protein
MLNLITLNGEELNKVRRNIEDHSPLIWKLDNFLKAAHNNLLEVVGQEYDRELRIILTNAARCIRYETKGFYISLKEANYQAANKTFKLTRNNAISSKRMSELLTILDKEGYITFCKGFYLDAETRCSSIIILKGILPMIDSTIAKHNGQSREELLSVIEIVDSKLTKRIKRINEKGNLVKDKEFVFKVPKGRGFKGLKEKRNNLFKYNKLIEQSVIIIDGEIHNCIIYKRRFEDNLLACGRYISGFQNELSYLRAGIIINGNKTCSVDYANCQPRMIAASKGIELGEDFDAYGVESLSRDFCKSLLFPALFSQSESGAKTSIKLKINKSEYAGQLTSTQVLEMFTNHNAFMADNFFNKEQYRILQNWESSMAEYVIDHFTAKGIVCLSYHDSFVVECQHRDELYSVMQEAWLNVMGSLKSCKLKKEHGWDTPIKSVTTTTSQEVEPIVEVGEAHTQEEIPLSYYEDSFVSDSCVDSFLSSLESRTTNQYHQVDNLPYYEDEYTPSWEDSNMFSDFFVNNECPF